MSTTRELIKNLSPEKQAAARERSIKKSKYRGRYDDDPRDYHKFNYVQNMENKFPVTLKFISDLNSVWERQAAMSTKLYNLKLYPIFYNINFPNETKTYAQIYRTYHENIESYSVDAKTGKYIKAGNKYVFAWCGSIFKKMWFADRDVYLKDRFYQLADEEMYVDLLSWLSYGKDWMDVRKWLNGTALVRPYCGMTLDHQDFDEDKRKISTYLWHEFGILPKN